MPEQPYRQVMERDLGQCVEWDCWKPAPYEYRDLGDPIEFWYALCEECAALYRADGGGIIIRTYTGWSPPAQNDPYRDGLNS